MRVVARFELAAPGSTKLQAAYYYNYCVPTIQAALREIGERKTEAQTDEWLVQMYPGEKDEREIGTGEEITQARHFSKGQMSDFLDWLKEFAAENLYVYIEDSRTL